MSNTTNDVLADEVRYYIDLYEGTTAGDMLQMAWDMKDLDQCRYLIQQLIAMEMSEV